MKAEVHLDHSQGPSRWGTEPQRGGTPWWSDKGFPWSESFGRCQNPSGLWALQESGLSVCWDQNSAPQNPSHRLRASCLRGQGILRLLLTLANKTQGLLYSECWWSLLKPTSFLWAPPYLLLIKNVQTHNKVERIILPRPCARCWDYPCFITRPLLFSSLHPAIQLTFLDAFQK